MKKIFILLFLLSFITVYSQNNKSVIAEGATVQKVETGFDFTEGPAVAADGKVYFSDQPNDKIHVWDPDHGVSLYIEGTGRSNGMYFNPDGQLITCADEKHEIILFDENRNQQILFDGIFEGKHLNGPNDLWIDLKGGIYFSDPFWQRDYWPAEHKRELEIMGVYYMSPEGKVTRVIEDFRIPNGLIGTPDGKTLYVADMGDRKTWKYDIEEDGTLSNKILFAPSGSDGVTIDNEGNIYLTSRNVLVYNSKGELIEEISVPEMPSNLCFGGKERKTLFITARTSVYSLKMNVKGVN